MPAAGHSGGGVSRAQIIAYAVQEAAAHSTPVALVLAIIQHESGFQANAVNASSGALGLMQIMPSVARSLGINARNWRENIEGGCRILANYRDDYGFNWFQALSAYAAGPGGVRSGYGLRMASGFMQLARTWRERGYDGKGDAKGSGKGGVKLKEDSAAKFIAIARRQLGERYVFGAEGPNAFDCSGLVYFGLNKAGIDIARSTANGYFQSVPRVSRDNLRPGDLLFFHYGRLSAGLADHVGIYIGDGKVLDTRSPEHPVMIRAVDWENVIGQGRVAGLDQSSQREINAALRGTGVGGGRGAASALGKAFKGDKVSRQELRGILRGFGLNPGAFDELITQAIQQQWNADELAAALYDSEIFKRMFPGIFNEDGSLKMTAAEWQRIAFGEGGYADIAKEFGIKLNRAKIGSLIEGDKSPDEWAFDAMVLRQSRSTEHYRQAYSAQLKLSGQSELSKREWFDYIAGAPNSRIENLYEAANLQTQLQIGPKAARKAAKQIGGIGEQVDIQDLINQVTEIQDFVRPELEAAGITPADLAVAKAGGIDPKNLRGSLTQILKNRSALVGQRLATQEGATGGGLFPELAESA